MSAWDQGESYYRVWDDVRNLSVTDFPSNFSICVTKRNHVPYYEVRGYIQGRDPDRNHRNGGRHRQDRFGSHALERNGPVIFEKGSVTKIKAGTTIMESGTEIRQRGRGNYSQLK